MSRLLKVTLLPWMWAACTEPEPVEPDVAEPVELGPIDGAATGEVTANGRVIAWTATPFPPVVGDAELTVTVDGVADEVAITPWMSVHGHGAGRLEQTGGDGTWTARWRYIMTGPWEVTIDVDEVSVVTTWDVE